MRSNNSRLLPATATLVNLGHVPGASTEIGLGTMTGSRADLQCVGFVYFGHPRRSTQPVLSCLLLLSRFVEHGGNANELGGGRLGACTNSLEENTNVSSMRSSSLGNRADMENVVSDLAQQCIHFAARELLLFSGAPDKGLQSNERTNERTPRVRRPMNSAVLQIKATTNG